MKIKWFLPALIDLQNIYNRCETNFGSSKAEHVSDQIQATVNLLDMFPAMGPFEPLLSHRSEPWHSLVIHRNIKAIYLIGSESVNIAALWDTRQRPNKLANYIDKLVKENPSILNEPPTPYIKIKRTDK